MPRFSGPDRIAWKPGKWTYRKDPNSGKTGARYDFFADIRFANEVRSVFIGRWTIEEAHDEAESEAQDMIADNIEISDSPIFEEMRAYMEEGKIEDVFDLITGISFWRAKHEFYAKG